MTADIHPQTLRAEAACYALLRRLAPAMRHHLVVNLQPIGMIYEVLERRLQSATPDLGQVRESAAKINGFTRAAVRSCLDVITWLAPEENATSTVAEAVEECLGLLNGNLNFRGFSINNECAGVLASVSRPAVRCLLTSAMLACTDINPIATARARTQPGAVLCKPAERLAWTLTHAIPAHAVPSNASGVYSVAAISVTARAQSTTPYETTLFNDFARI